MAIKQQLKDLGDSAKTGLAIGAFIAIPYVALTIAANAVMLPFEAAFNGLERAVGAKERTELLTLNKTKLVRAHSVCAYSGEFTTQAGERKTLFDTYDLPTGKFFADGLGSAQTGKVYRVTSLEGPISSKLLSMTPQPGASQ